MLDIPDRKLAGASGFSLNARGVSEAGKIVGFAVDANGNHGLIARPKP